MRAFFKKDYLQNGLILLGVLHLVCWTLTPALLHSNAPLDVIEAIAWGQQWQWGYDHDPFLVGWLAYGVSWLAGNAVWPVYVLSQLCILTTFWAIWRLARLLNLSEAQAIISVILLEAIFYYNFATPEFNDNVLQLPLWALTVSFFYSALKNQGTRDWCLTALFAGLAMMAKYYTIMLFFPMILIIFGSQEGRQSFKNPGIYWALMLGSLIILPNLIWQFQHDFQYLGYALSRANVVDSWKNHWFYPLLFCLNQLAVILPCFLLYFWSVRSFKKNPTTKTNFDQLFLVLIAWGPFISTLIYSALTGSHMLSMWGMPLFSFVGLWLVYHLRPDLSSLESQRIFHGALLSFFTALSLYIGIAVLPPYLMGHAKTVSFPSAQLAAAVGKIWHEHYEQPLPYIVGPRELAGRVTVYSKEHPIPYFEWSAEASPWVKMDNLQHKGAVFVWNADVVGDQIPAEIHQLFPRLHQPIIVKLNWQTKALLKPVRVALAILPADL